MSKMSSSPHNQPEEIIIQLPETGKFVDFNQIISDAPEGSTLRLEQGKYQLDETINLEKSIRLVGGGINKSVLQGKGLPLLVSAKGSNNIDLEGLTFEIGKNDTGTTAVSVFGGVLSMRSCSFAGGVSFEGNLGMGLSVEGRTEVDIRDCQFTDNQESGLIIGSECTGSVTGCISKSNDAGIVIADNAKVDVSKCVLFENHVGIAYDGTASGRITANKIHDQRGGIMVKGNATPVIERNQIFSTKGAIGLAETCDVHILNNDIYENEIGILARFESKAVIEKNQIYKNEEGIHLYAESQATIINNEISRQIYYGIVLSESSESKISSNQINENHKTGIITQDQATFEIKDNYLGGNFQVGIHVRGRSDGSVRNNTLRNNGHFNLYRDDGEKKDFEKNNEKDYENYPVTFRDVDGELIVTAAGPGVKVSFEELLRIAQPGQTIIFENGYYIPDKPIDIYKPLSIIAREPLQVHLNNGNLDYLLRFSGQEKLILRGIHFNLWSLKKANVVIVESGELEMDECKVGMVVDPEWKKRDLGAGLLIRGNSRVNVNGSEFLGNFLGISVLDHATADISKSCFTVNEYGMIFRDQSAGTISDNECHKNRGYGIMAYDESSLTLVRNQCHENLVGIGFINNAKGVIENNESFENENHGFFIDNEVQCTFRNNESHSNGINGSGSGFGVYGNSNTIFKGNNVFGNGQCGFEICENAKAVLTSNKINGNSNAGLYLTDNSSTTIEQNDISENDVGIRLLEGATAKISNNKIHHNDSGGIQDKSNQESTIGDNKLFDNGEENIDDNDDEDDEEESESDGTLSFGFSIGDLLAKALGSENLSDDPNTAVIPLGDLLARSGNQDNEENDEVNEEEEDDQDE